MRPHCPGCERGLIILLSSSNQAVGEINGYGKLRWKRTEGERMCVGELRLQESRVRDQPLGERGKEEGGEGGRECGGRGNQMEGRVPPLAICSFATVRVFRMTI